MMYQNMNKNFDTVKNNSELINGNNLENDSEKIKESVTINDSMDKNYYSKYLKYKQKYLQLNWRLFNDNHICLFARQLHLL
jgi:hypothetical protein